MVDLAIKWWIFPWFIDGWPIKNCDFPWRTVSHHQRLNLVNNFTKWFHPRFSPGFSSSVPQVFPICFFRSLSRSARGGTPRGHQRLRGRSGRQSWRMQRQQSTQLCARVLRAILTVAFVLAGEARTFFGRTFRWLFVFFCGSSIVVIS